MSLDRDPAGGDHVDGDAVGGEFFGHAAGPSDLPPFGGDVGGEVGV